MDADRRAELAEELPEIARHTSERERRANDAERELVQWKKVRFMADKVGDEFEGYITGVSAFGLFIELVEHFVEGMVHVSTMADDYYRFVERAHMLRGEKNGRVYRLGDRVDSAGHSRRPRTPADRPRPDGDSRRGAAIGAQPRGAPHSRAQPKRGEPQPRTPAARGRGRPGRRRTTAPSEARTLTIDRAMTTVVIGTAGHIDHGKSALVRALTGIEPDRLKEEQARGITIDLGFRAHSRSAASTVAFVDVPGHERFVRNMLAGAGGIDAVMLVVDARRVGDAADARALRDLPAARHRARRRSR